MNTVINQLVKEAAYHAAKYDSTINAIRAIASSGRNSSNVKTADWNDIAQAVQPYVEGSWDYLDNIANNIGSGISNMWNEAGDFTNQWLADGQKAVSGGIDTLSDALAKNNAIQSALGAAEGFGKSLGDTTMNLPQGVGIGLMGAAGGGALGANVIANAAKKDMAVNAADFAQQLASQNSANNSAIKALKDQLGAANAQNADLFANASARFQNAGNDALAKLKGLGGSIADMGAAAKNKLMGLGGDIVNAAKAHPYAAAGLGLAGAGAAALPFLLGGEKEGSYDPYKLQVLRSVLSGM